MKHKTVNSQEKNYKKTISKNKNKKVGQQNFFSYNIVSINKNKHGTKILYIQLFRNILIRFLSISNLLLLLLLFTSSMIHS